MLCARRGDEDPCGHQHSALFLCRVQKIVLGNIAEPKTAIKLAGLVIGNPYITSANNDMGEQQCLGLNDTFCNFETGLFGVAPAGGAQICHQQPYPMQPLVERVSIGQCYRFTPKS